MACQHIVMAAHAATHDSQRYARTMSWIPASAGKTEVKGLYVIY
jgi:hypothetical protein